MTELLSHEVWLEVAGMAIAIGLMQGEPVRLIFDRPLLLPPFTAWLLFAMAMLSIHCGGGFVLFVVALELGLSRWKGPLHQEPDTEPRLRQLVNGAVLVGIGMSSLKLMESMGSPPLLQDALTALALPAAAVLARADRVHFPWIQALTWGCIPQGSFRRDPPVVLGDRPAAPPGALSESSLPTGSLTALPEDEHLVPLADITDPRLRAQALVAREVARQLRTP